MLLVRVFTLFPLQLSELIALRVVLGQLASVALVPELEILVPPVEAIPITTSARYLRPDPSHPTPLKARPCKQAHVSFFTLQSPITLDPSR